MTQACALLHRLGVTANYKGYAYAAYAAALCVERPDLLLLVTKNLYPEVARRYQTTWQAVERGIRSVIAVVWARNPALLGRMAGGALEGKPRSTQFLAIITAEIQFSGVK